VFRKNEIAVDSRSKRSSAEEGLLIDGAGVSLAVLPFVDLSARPLATLFAQGITDELIHTLAQADGLRVISKTYLSQFTSASWDIPSLAEKLGVQSIVEGTVSEKDGWLEITITVVRTDGFQTSSHRFETQVNTETISKVGEASCYCVR